MRRFKVKADPQKAGDLGTARKAAVAVLAGRDFASGELLEKLVTQGYVRETAAQAVAELQAANLLDDARYAEHYVAYRRERGQGPVRIAADLRALGLEAALIEAALASVPSWAAAAREVRSRKFGREGPHSWAEKGRQARFLQYRGFSSDHIRVALDGDFDLDEGT